MPQGDGGQPDYVTITQGLRTACLLGGMVLEFIVNDPAARDAWVAREVAKFQARNPLGTRMPPPPANDVLNESARALLHVSLALSDDDTLMRIVREVINEYRG
jgi:hypothetical protein